QRKRKTVSELRETKVRQGRFIYIEPSVHCGHSKCFTDEKKWCVCVFLCVCVSPVVFSLDFMAGVTCILSGSIQCGSSARTGPMTLDPIILDGSDKPAAFRSNYIRWIR